MQDFKLNILGTEYQIMFRTEQDDHRLEDSDGYFDHSSKMIVCGEFEPDKWSVSDLKAYQKKVLRHEILHAFLYESGVWNNSGGVENWALSEEMTDWFAIQSPKIFEAYREAGAM